jgi:hypothetical protein
MNARDCRASPTIDAAFHGRVKPADKCPDGPQYKAYGNSMAIPFMRWIGMRIDLIERLTREGKIP